MRTKVLNHFHTFHPDAQDEFNRLTLEEKRLTLAIARKSEGDDLPAPKRRASQPAPKPLEAELAEVRARMDECRKVIASGVVRVVIKGLTRGEFRGKALVMTGVSGAGKSTVLTALNVFFRQSTEPSVNLSTLTEEDFHKKPINPVNQRYESELLASIIKQINDNIFEIITIEDLCQHFSISRSTLQHIFKNNFIQWINR